MANLIDRVRRHLLVRIARLVLAEFFVDLRQPLVELLDRPSVERRKGADDTGLALGDHQFGT
jgi:hypothetical protein